MYTCAHMHSHTPHTPQTPEQHHSLHKSTKQCAAKGEGRHAYTTEACYAWECVWEGGLYPCLSQDGGKGHLHHPTLTPRLDDVLQVVAHVVGGVLLLRGRVFGPRLLLAEWSPFPWDQAALVRVWQKRKRSPLWSVSDRKETITATVHVWQKRNNHRYGLRLTEKKHSPLWSASDRKETITAMVCVWQKRNNHRYGLRLTEKKQSPLWSASDAPLRSMSDRRKKKSPLWSLSDTLLYVWQKENDHRYDLHLTHHSDLCLTEKKTITTMVCVWHTALVCVWLTALIYVWLKRKWSLPRLHLTEKKMITILICVWFATLICIWQKKMITALVCVWRKRKWSPLWYASDRKKKKKKINTLNKQGSSGIL